MARTAWLSESLVAGIKDDGGEDAVATIMDMATARTVISGSFDEFLVQVANSEDLDLPADARKALALRLKELLDQPTLAISSKAEELLDFHERVFSSGRIITDARPVWLGEAEGDPFGWEIAHALRLSVREGGQVQELVVGLDAEDLATLASVIVRAQAKAASIGRIFRAKGLRVIEQKSPSNRSTGR